mmetsp:Transcript_114140/g.207606  ORF Transcript_114140/g.207606 Transcript_114140/m.207606 type:complete len:425 (-) Transcript_114140:109-1383(-)
MEHSHLKLAFFMVLIASSAGVRMDVMSSMSTEVSGSFSKFRQSTSHTQAEDSNIHTDEPDECLYGVEGCDQMTSVCYHHWEFTGVCKPCENPKHCPLRVAQASGHTDFAHNKREQAMLRHLDVLDDETPVTEASPSECPEGPCMTIDNQATVQLNILAVSKFKNEARFTNHIPPGGKVIFDSKGRGVWKFFVVMDDCEMQWKEGHENVELVGKVLKLAAPINGLAWKAGAAVAGVLAGVVAWPVAVGAGIAVGGATYVGAGMLVEAGVQAGQEELLMAKTSTYPSRVKKIKELQMKKEQAPRSKLSLLEVLRGSFGIEGDAPRAYAQETCPRHNLQNIIKWGVASVGEKNKYTASNDIDVDSAISYLQAMDKLFITDKNFALFPGSKYVIGGGFIPHSNGSCTWQPLTLGKDEGNGESVDDWED